MPSSPRITVIAFALTALSLSIAGQQPVYHAAMEPVQDPALAALPGGVMLSVPGLRNDFVIAGGGQFVELPNGTARLTGSVQSVSSMHTAFLVDLEFANRVAPGNPGYPPAPGPDLQLLAAAYTPTGPVDPGAFVYYTQVTGSLVGLRNLAGALVDVQATGNGAQLGAGANNRNGALGLSAAFQLTVLRQPAFPVLSLTTAELTVDLPSHRTDEVTHVQPDAAVSPLSLDRALSLPGVADDYLFVPAGAFTEFADGHAELSGTLARLNQLDDAWDLTLMLTSRVDPGTASYPPTGSPVLQLLSSAYVAGGGTLDPGHWRYYETVTGTLTGVGLNAGGSITLAQNGALQYGGGANQANTYCGCYAVLTATVTAQPTARTISVTGDAELLAVCSRKAVLPPPTLTTPSTPLTLPTLTSQGLIISGDNLAWVDRVGLDTELEGLGDGSRWFDGYFQLIDNQTIELHPRPGKLPGTYAMSAYTPATRSNSVPLTLTTPTSQALYSEPVVPPLRRLHVLVHKGPMSGPALSAIAMSWDLLPTIFPGYASLGIGNQGASLMVVPGSFFHDPTTGVARFDFGPIPFWFTGFDLHFQSVTLDLTTMSFPLPVSNTWTVTF